MAIETVTFQTSALASPPSGTAVAVDTIGGAEYQVIKLALGADGAFDTLVDSGQQTMANSIPVAIASNQSNVPISIEVDNVGIGGGTEYAVDAALGATPTGKLALAKRDDALSALTPVEGDAIELRVDANGALWVIPSGTLIVTDDGSFTLAANSGVDIGDVDVTSVVPGTGATNLGKAEDAGHSSGDVGVMALAVRQTADTPLSGTDLDYEPLQTDENGYLKVNVKAGGGTGGTSQTDDAPFTAGSGAGTPAMGFATSDTVDAGDVGVLAMDTSRNLKVSIEVDNVGIGGGTQYAVDTGLGATPTGTLALAIRDDALSALTPVEGDAIGLRVDANGALWVIPNGTVTVTDDGSFTLAANSGVDIGDVDVLTIPGTAAEGAALPSVFVVVAGDDGTDTQPLQLSAGGDLKVTLDSEVVTVDLGVNNDVIAAGDVADDAADSGNPIKVGGVAVATDGTDPGSVAEGDRANLRTDLNRRLLVNDVHPNLFDADDNQSTAQTNKQLQAAPGAGLRFYITDIIMSTDTAMNIKLVTDTAGSPADLTPPFYFAANGGLTTNFRTPIPVPINQDVGYTSSAAGNHSVKILGYIGP